MTEQVTDPNVGRKHSLYGGSSIARVLACPGSVALVAPLPEREETTYQSQGLALHAAAAHALANNTPLDDLIGSEFHNIEITKEHVEQKLKPAWIALAEISEMLGYSEKNPAEVLEEQELAYCPNEGDDPNAQDLRGTADVVLGSPGGAQLAIIDFKFGDGVPVSAAGNQQLRMYAACAMFTRGVEGADDLAALVSEANVFHLAIIQPGVGSKDWSMDTLNDGDLLEWLDKAENMIDVSKQPGAELSLGEHCKFCPAKTKCPAQQDGLSQIAKITEGGVPAHNMAHMLELAHQAEDMIKNLRQEALDFLESGGEIPGWCLCPKRAQRVWNNEDEAEAILKKRLGATKAYTRKLLSVTQAEKELGGKRFKNLGEIWSSVSSGLRLTRNDGTKTPVTPTRDLSQVKDKIEPPASDAPIPASPSEPADSTPAPVVPVVPVEQEISTETPASTTPDMFEQAAGEAAKELT